MAETGLARAASTFSNFVKRQARFQQPPGRRRRWVRRSQVQAVGSVEQELVLRKASELPQQSWSRLECCFGWTDSNVECRFTSGTYLATIAPCQRIRPGSIPVSENELAKIIARGGSSGSGSGEQPDEDSNDKSALVRPRTGRSIRIGHQERHQPQQLLPRLSRLQTPAHPTLQAGNKLDVHLSLSTTTRRALLPRSMMRVKRSQAATAATLIRLQRWSRLADAVSQAPDLTVVQAKSLALVLQQRLQLALLQASVLVLALVSLRTQSTTLTTRTTTRMTWSTLATLSKMKISHLLCLSNDKHVMIILQNTDQGSKCV